jgi:hypothetical protein
MVFIFREQVQRAATDVNVTSPRAARINFNGIWSLIAALACIRTGVRLME